MKKRGLAKENSLVEFPLTQQVLSGFQKRHPLSDEALALLLEQTLLRSSSGETFPSSIFHKDLTVLESVVKYLRERKKYSLHTCSQVLQRNEKNLWHTYAIAKKKVHAFPLEKEGQIVIPFEIFSHETHSPQEAVVIYLKDKEKLTFHHIAQLLFRDDRTIFTAYHRGKKKDAE